MSLDREYQSDYVTLPSEAIPDIRKALSHGLWALVEVIRVRDEADGARGMGEAWPDDGVPIIPAQNSAESLAPIASALLWLDRVAELTKETPR